jgi:hypothetical protein
MTNKGSSLSFARDTRPLFTDVDVAHVKHAMDLSNRDSFFEHAEAICSAVTGRCRRR